jgi:hypothetical protein
MQAPDIPRTKSHVRLSLLRLHQSISPGPMLTVCMCSNKLRLCGEELLAKSGEYGGWGMIAISYFARNCWVRTEV